MLLKNVLLVHRPQASYFGLQYVTKRGRDWWLVLDKPIRKQLEQHGQDGCHNTALKFRVHFFVSDFNQLHDEITRSVEGIINLYLLQ